MVFATTSARDQRLQELFRVLPTFSRESRRTLTRLESFARTTNPLVSQLRPAARELSPALSALDDLSPDLRALFTALGPLITASQEGFPAGRRVLDDLRPVLGQVDPWLRQLNPVLDFLGLYRREITAFLANSTAATQVTPSGSPLHYLRTTNPLNAENLAAYPRRVGTNRPNPYALPGAFDKLRNGLDVYLADPCDNGTPPADEVTGGEDVPPKLLEGVKRYAFRSADNPSVAPPCRLQDTIDFGGERTRYPHVREQP